MMNNTMSVGDLIDRYTEPNANSINLSQAANTDEVFAFVNHETPNPTVSLITGVTGGVLTIPTYVIGNGSLRLFRNGVLMSLNSGATGDQKYVETSTTSVTLTVAAAVTDVFKVYISNPAPTFRVSTSVATGTVITIPGGNSYTMGNKKLLVFRNGLLLVNSLVLGNPVDRYQETSTTSITLGTAVVSGDLLEFIYI